jgi:hypothetical protein
MYCRTCKGSRQETVQYTRGQSAAIQQHRTGIISSEVNTDRVTSSRRRTRFLCRPSTVRHLGRRSGTFAATGRQPTPPSGCL